MVSLLTAVELADRIRLEPKNYMVVDARPPSDFAAGHIPGAISMAWEDWCEAPPSTCQPVLHEPGYWGVIADPVATHLATRIAAAGISNDSRVVVYADGAESKGREGRIAWMLLYFGVASVCLLNGGWTAWLASGNPIETKACRPQQGRFTLEVCSHRRSQLCDLQLLYETDRMPLMIDTRTLDEFDGNCFEYQPRKGRIPNSILFPYSALFDPSGAFVSREHYMESVPPGILNAPSLVAYCEVGVRASTFALIHEVYTGNIVSVFDGSIMQWGVQSSLPVAVSGLAMIAYSD
jgi:thiosulfate/3-mercaptopyruvate sulfurtransferase